MADKLERLQGIVKQMERVAVAFSGGVDSTLLLKVAHDCLGDHLLAVTALSPTLPDSERAEAEALARYIGARHVFRESQEMDDPLFLENGPDRCYHCKLGRYRLLAAYAQREGYGQVIDGANADDTGDHRPGLMAARELGVRSPLQEVGLTKAEIRVLARSMDLPNWDQPSNACLASRIPYGDPITLDKLSRVAQAEQVLRELGVRQMRVRDHGQIARIELEARDLQVAFEHRGQIVRTLRALGYTYVALDLDGFRSGSMNEVLESYGPGKINTDTT
jgi:uncharacterized protein